jgi:hypothetical protein
LAALLWLASKAVAQVVPVGGQTGEQSTVQLTITAEVPHIFGLALSKTSLDLGTLDDIAGAWINGAFTNRADEIDAYVTDNAGGHQGWELDLSLDPTSPQQLANPGASNPLLLGVSGFGGTGGAPGVVGQPGDSAAGGTNGNNSGWDGSISPLASNNTICGMNGGTGVIGEACGAPSFWGAAVMIDNATSLPYPMAVNTYTWIVDYTLSSSL